MTYRTSNDAFYASGYWRRWPREDVWLDARIRLAIFQRWLQPDGREALLDLAGGAGNFADRLSSSFGCVVLTDIAVDALRQNRNPAVLRVQADLQSLPFRAGSFSRILLCDVLEHLAEGDLPNVLAEVHRISRPGAIVVVFTNCRGLRLRPLLLRLQGRVGRGELDWKDLQDGHLNRLTDKTLSTLIETTGFRIRRKRHFSHVFEPLVTAALDLLRSERPGRVAPGGAPLRGRRGLAKLALAGLTCLMALDLVLLGRIPGGGVFLAAERSP